MSTIGRTVGIFRAGAQVLRRGTQRVQVRRAGDGPHIEAQYRQPPQLTKHQQFHAELLSGAMWFWILWHSWHDPDAVLGHFPWPDMSAWTDEELGIPPDDE
ncbi:NADH dehydrogenase [ubiquinone] 1 beta subcomplex subunit 2, mitochondrial [Astyanax mexicanus]|uniref:NADH dehydrogenase [ubiquinone] 1 beta subcomplex subunit 2, mitochondrial n=2 Tax=Astyanax mexicanus TaxID=7994 RepID=A0A8B9LFW3_ASTMX|nr:NADH dehydrogenase [ubiquinone] 1 beta subcomplex subunit 2, mitochondrial [Astyanax mexicanus]XP_007232777.1 NADH dehydrogenase [ubiquinone] 1 beta subcomplex subunit 2, mitochondrial [Astyanax mexicanus]KAG9280480.1 NADH dehydrogenase ubiquinone 1 beta subcomplex subunit 2, mitochondrial [Astyanax mexicanus]